ncbi:hypothetical protein E2L92_22010 [Salmonella enterica subsp. enterica serovar Ibadan]|nr:hypothetical protein [Salmonella enterica subsp. enterica serovar Ibadan]ECF3282128.1 hypothetical protein [Salmonella enterica subsp. enterica serovar Ibadan]
MNDLNFNPLAPEFSPTADQMRMSYRERAAQLRGETSQATTPAFNPFNVDQPTQEDSQGKHISNMEQYLSPIKIDGYDPQTSYTEEKHDNYLKNVSKDKAIQEYGPQLEAYLDSLVKAKQAGQLSDDDAMQMGVDYFNNHVKPVIHKHKSKDDYSSSLHRKEIEIPDIVKKVRGVK